jgi:NAD(P)-dependent dehydrogenase (short-subunit alcohol dehydrogenase family)
MDARSENSGQELPPQQQEEPGIESEMTPRPRYKAPEYRAAGKLTNKVALITGGDSGIGRAVALMYAREGADVAIVYLPAEQSDADETRQEIERAGRRALLLPGDITDSGFCHAAVQRTVHELGHLDILVNNSAFQQSQPTLEEIDEQQWDQTFRTNIYGFFYMTKAALPHLKAGAAIINCGSVAGLQGNKTLIDYAATKGAIHAFTKSLAQNLVERRIRVNCVAPGPIWTVLQPVSKPAKQVAQHGVDNPMQRPGQPEEVAPAFVYFASDADSSYVTGEVLTITGGETMAA